MMKKSPREGYESVEKIPPQLDKFLEGITGNNAEQIASALRKSPFEAIIGECRRPEKRIHLPQKSEWRLITKENGVREFRTVSTDCVPQGTVVCAVGKINEELRESEELRRANLKFAVWFECKMGNPKVLKVKPGQKGDRLKKDSAPFKVGLVDKNRPKNGG